MGWAGPQEPPSRGSRPPPLRPAEIFLVLRTGREGRLGAVAAALALGQDVRCGGLGAPGRCQVTPRNRSRGNAALQEPLLDVSESFCCSALGKAGERSEGDVESCASSPCVEGNLLISGRNFGF